MTDTVTPLAYTRPPLGLTLRSMLVADFAVLFRTPLVLALNVAVPFLYIVVTSLNGLHGGGKHVFADPASAIGLPITFGLMSAGMLGYATFIARDRDAGVFQRLRVTPTPSWTIMASRIVVQLASALVMSIAVLIVGSLLHGFAITWQEAVGVLGVSLLGSTMFLAIGQAIVGLLRSATAVSAVTRVLFIVFILVGLLGATGLLGDAFKAFSTWTPVGAEVNLFAAVFGSPWTSDTTSGIIAVPAYAIVFAVIGIRFFRWESR